MPIGPISLGHKPQQLHFRVAKISSQAHIFATRKTHCDKPVTASMLESSLATPPEGYGDWQADLKGRIYNIQQRA